MARGDIHIVKLPETASGSAGREQVGRRPALAIEATIPGVSLSTTIVIPMTSNKAALRFPYTLEIVPSDQNGLSKSSVVLIFQLRAIDRKRITKKIGKLEKNYMDRIEQEIRRMLGL